MRVCESRGPGTHRLGKQRLAGARRPHEKHALGDFGAELCVLLGVFQKVDHLLQGTKVKTMTLYTNDVCQLIESNVACFAGCLHTAGPRHDDQWFGKRDKVSVTRRNRSAHFRCGAV